MPSLMIQMQCSYLFIKENLRFYESWCKNFIINLWIFHLCISANDSEIRYVVLISPYSRRSLQLRWFTLSLIISILFIYWLLCKSKMATNAYKDIGKFKIIFCHVIRLNIFINKLVVHSWLKNWCLKEVQPWKWSKGVLSARNKNTEVLNHHRLTCQKVKYDSKDKA